MNDQDYILFETYLLGNLTEKENATFKNRLHNETEFKHAFDTYSELSGFLEHKFENEEKLVSFQNNLKNIGNAYFDKQKTTKRVIKFRPWQYAIAASLVLFIGVFSYNLFSIPSYGDFASYDTINLTVRGSQNDLITNAEKAFNTKNFTDAETYFSQLLSTDINNQELQLYKAISEIELNKFDKAEILLTKISQGNSAFKNKAIWYLALSKLKQKEYKECIEILKSIPEEAEDYTMAQKLLKKID